MFPRPLQVVHVGRQSFASWPLGSLPLCCAHIVHQIGQSLLQCPMLLQFRHLFDDGWAGGEGGRLKSEEPMRRKLPTKLLFRFGVLVERGGVRGSVPAIMLSTARSMVSAYGRTRVDIGASKGLNRKMYMDSGREDTSLMLGTYGGYNLKEGADDTGLRAAVDDGGVFRRVGSRLTGSRVLEFGDCGERGDSVVYCWYAARDTDTKN
jgi:hypothetical protein